jgi:hypothetical protein
LSVLLRYMGSDYPFGIFKLFLSFCTFSFGHSGTHNLCLAEEFEDTKGVIRIRISKKNRQHNGQKKKYKRTRRVWRYQRGNQIPYIEEEQTTQWPKDKQRSTKHTYKLLLHMMFTSRNWFTMQGPVAIILISWNVIFIWETGNWTQG